jgi:predicted RNA binding protein YcfA (HicA-like mRNA interferase family)
MGHVPILRPKEVVRALKKLGFAEQRQSGSHLTLVRAKDKVMVVVPIHPKAIGKGLMHAIIKKSGVTVEEFINLL